MLSKLFFPHFFMWILPLLSNTNFLESIPQSRSQTDHLTTPAMKGRAGLYLGFYSLHQSPKIL